jgi:molybdopterin converting factor small subunit
MPTVVLAAPLAARLPSALQGETTFAVTGPTVRAALDDLFARVPELRGYVLDDQGALRHHVAAFVDGVVVQDKRTLAQPVGPDAEIYLMQALSGG